MGSSISASSSLTEACKYKYLGEGLEEVRSFTHRSAFMGSGGRGGGSTQLRDRGGAMSCACSSGPNDLASIMTPRRRGLYEASSSPAHLTSQIMWKKGFFFFPLRFCSPLISPPSAIHPAATVQARAPWQKANRVSCQGLELWEG